MVVANLAELREDPGFIFFGSLLIAQGDTFEQARENLRDVVEGNVMLALQLGWAIPHVEGIAIEERDVQTVAA